MALSQAALSQGIWPQSLGQPSMATGITVQVQNMAGGLKNVYNDPSNHLQVLYSAKETPYMSNMSCPVGVATVNSVCGCPGMPSGSPFRQGIPIMSQNYLQSLFSPIEPSLFPQPSASAMALIAERSMCGPQAYKNMDDTPLTQCNGTCF
jgi:hypothetical protein